MKRQIQERKKVAITVFMSVYDPRPLDLLEEAVGSVLEQSFSDLELLIYDDGSDEKTKRELSRLAAQDKRIRLLSGEKNRGLAWGLNQCILKARGKYLARMDADDISFSRRLSVQYHFLENHKDIDFVGCAAFLLGNDGIWGKRILPQTPSLKDYLSFSPFIHPSVMFRREVFEKHGLYETGTEFLRCEDYELFFRFYKAGLKGCNLPDPLFLYREDKNSYKKRTFQSRRMEAKFRRRAFADLKLSWPVRFWCLYKPYMIALLPSWSYEQIKKAQNVRNGIYRSKIFVSGNAKKKS